tara:strand:- start:65 stop:1015 length:951 start_codon:yes stop_codon:yes gene_type:complete
MDRVSAKEKLKILSDTLGSYYREGSAQHLFTCPKCNHHKKKLSVNVEKNVFKCWVCDFSGANLYRIIKRYGDYNSRKNWLALDRQVDVADFSEKIFGQQDEPCLQQISLPSEFLSLANSNLHPSAMYALNYLNARGLEKQDILKWKIGYCYNGEYSNRIVIPSFDLNGDLNYFVARAYDKNWRRYLNPKKSSDIIFNELSIDFDSDLTIVEGVFDAIKAGENSVPLLGSTLSESCYLLQKIVEADTTVYLALDSDAPGKTDKILKLLLKYNVEVYLVDISPYEDVGEMTKSIFAQKKEQSCLLNSDNYLLSKIMRL